MSKNVIHIIISSCILIVLVFDQCKFSKDKKSEKREDRKIEEIIGENVKIKFDSTFILYRNKIHTLSDYNYNNGNPKIVSRIYGDCHVCIKALKKWKKSEIIRQFDTLGVKIMFYIFSDEYKYFEEKMYPKIVLSHPLIIDTTNSFLRENSFIGINKNNHTLLLNSNNKVLLVGNPINNKKLMKLYKEEINKRLN